MCCCCCRNSPCDPIKKVHLYIIKSLTNTNDGKTLVAENVVASNSASAPIGTTVAEPNGRRRRIERGKLCQRLEIDREIAVEGIQVEIGIERVGENKKQKSRSVEISYFLER